MCSCGADLGEVLLMSLRRRSARREVRALLALGMMVTMRMAKSKTFQMFSK
jgi:hypothetical protein